MKENHQDLKTVKVDYLLIGAGIMSAHLATFFKKLSPDKSIMIVERLNDCGLESSAVLNNAGTGHAGYCELNYTPLDPETNTVNTTKAVKVNNAFNKSIEFWRYLISKNEIKGDFLNHVPHYSFVQGKENVEYLAKRHSAMTSLENFKNIKFSQDTNEITEWLPLVMTGRDKTQPVAVTRADDGYDINFGKLTKYLISNLESKDVTVNYGYEVVDIYKVYRKLQFDADRWHIIQRNLKTNELTKIITDFVFIGAGGAAINLLAKADVYGTESYGGFPVSGEFLICKNPDVVKQHQGKVYGNPSVGAPPMSTPHLDTRIVDGEPCLLFGPFAGMSTKFLKNGSWLDFFKSITLGNIQVMIDAGLRNMGLNKYLISELAKGSQARFNTLKEYYPNADINDWTRLVAAQRVQIIKEVNGEGVIEFGTEVVTDEDGSLACLLGASPGASTTVKIMLDLLDKCFILDEETKKEITEMIPSYK